MSSKIVRISTDAGSYAFKYILNYEDNFGDLQTQFTNLPGADGAFDEDGEVRAKKGKGVINFEIGYRVFTDAEASQMYDDLAKIISYPRGRLYLQSADSTLEERWCDVRLKKMPKKMNINQHDDYLRKLPITFETDSPYWYSTGTYGSQWDDAIWDIAEWENPIIQACSGLQTDFAVVRVGTAPVNPTITIACSAGESVTSLKIQRLVNGVPADEVFYSAALVATDSLMIDAYTWEIKLNGADAYNSNFVEQRIRWMELQPANNDLRVILGDASDACTVTVNHFEAWN